MFLKKLETNGFRNLSSLSLEFSENVNIIFGENGQGKTNLLEAIWLLSGNKSFRGAQDRDFFKFDSENFFIGAKVFDGEKEFLIKIGAQNGPLVLKKVVRDEKNYKSVRALLGALPMTVFSPDDLEIIKAGPLERRNYCDLLLATLFPFYSKTLSRYNRILAQKNAALKSDFPENAEIFNEQLATFGASVIKSRIELIKRLLPYAQKCFFDMAGEKDSIDLKYSCSFLEDSEKSEEEIREIFKNKLCENAFKEKNAESSLYGPHRDDIEIFINGKKAKSFASQGQQRSAVLALLLAKTELIKKETGKTPIILLDDVMSELDLKRRNYLSQKIEGFQVFITCCQQEFEMQVGKKFLVTNGSVREV